MNKTELIKTVAEKSELSQNQVNAALNSLIDVIVECVRAEENVKLPGFGTFRCKKTVERYARNPATQEKVLCPASKKLVFTAGTNTKNL